MMSKSKELLFQEIELAKEIFSLGVEVGKFEDIVGLDQVNYQKDVILETVSTSLGMSMLLEELFERGKAIGERRRRNKIFTDT